MTPEISKFIGWDGPSIQNYPTMEQVNSASDIQLCRWYRFLTSPVTDDEIAIINRIVDLVYPCWHSLINAYINTFATQVAFFINLTIYFWKVADARPEYSESDVGLWSVY